MLVVGWWNLTNEKPPQFFPLDNSESKYFVTRNCPPQGWHDKPAVLGETYCVIYNGTGVFLNEESGNTDAFTVVIARSKIDLRPFENKHVKNIKGEFVRSSKQCIKDKCININGPYVALNIDELEIAK